MSKDPVPIQIANGVMYALLIAYFTLWACSMLWMIQDFRQIKAHVADREWVNAEASK